MDKFKLAMVAVDESLGQIPEWVQSELNENNIEWAYEECTTREELSSFASDADLVWVHGGSKVVTADSIKDLKNCGAIIRAGSGTDNIPVAEATELGIVVAHTPDATREEVSDHTIGLILAVVRQIGLQDRAIHNGNWDLDSNRPRCQMQGQTLGLIGFGNIARIVVRKLNGFEMNFIVYDKFVSAEAIDAAGAKAKSLDEVMAQSDIVSIHCPWSPDTFHLIGEHELRLMKSSGILINTSRGKVIDEAALIKALCEGWFEAAGLDVLYEEPPHPDNPLLKMDNVVLTPHNAGTSNVSHENFWRYSLDTAIAFSQGHWPRYYVNHDVKPRWQLT